MGNHGNPLLRIIGLVLQYLPLTPIWVIFWSLVVFILCGICVDDHFMRKNGIHGLLMGVLWIPIIILAFIPVIGWLLNFLYFLLFFVVMILNILGAMDGNFFGLPVLGDCAGDHYHHY